MQFYIVGYIENFEENYIFQLKVLWIFSIYIYKYGYVYINRKEKNRNETINLGKSVIYTFSWHKKYKYM